MIFSLSTQVYLSRVQLSRGPNAWGCWRYIGVYSHSESDKKTSLENTWGRVTFNAYRSCRSCAVLFFRPCICAIFPLGIPGIPDGFVLKEEQQWPTACLDTVCQTRLDRYVPQANLLFTSTHRDIRAYQWTCTSHWKCISANNLKLSNY